MDTLHVLEIMEFVSTLADKSRFMINSFADADLATRYKTGGDGPVTTLDYNVEVTWSALIGKRFPEHGILGEETGATRFNDYFVWLLDPIDGTDDLIRGIPLFGSIISLLYRGFPIVGLVDHPRLNQRYVAGYGVGSFRNGERLNLNNAVEANLTDLIVVPAYDDFRHLNMTEEASAALNVSFPNQRIYRNVYGHTLTIAGKTAACLEVNVSPWDIAASQLLVEEAQGKFVSIGQSGVDYHYGRISAVFGRKSVVDQITSVVKG